MLQSWWLANLWADNPVIAISWIFWVIFSICCHELGHGFAAIRRGDDTPILAGHMTWNPLVHMGTNSLIMLLICGIAWGAMPVNPNRIKGRHGDAYVAAAGPAVNFGLFLTCAILCGIWTAVPSFLSDAAMENVALFLFVGAWLNIILMLFNLIPVPPLDGSRIAASFYRPYANFVYSDSGAVASTVAFVLLFFVGGRFVRHFGFETATYTISNVARIFRPLFHGTP